MFDILKKSIKLILAILLICSATSAQELRFFTAVKNDTLHIFLNQTLKIGQGFHVERLEKSKYIRLTSEPIKGEMNPVIVRDHLGFIHDELLSALKVSSTEQLLLKLRNDNYYGTLATLMDKRVAQILGRYWATSIHSETIYRLLVVNSQGDILQKIEQKVKPVEINPKPVENFKLKQEKNDILITWDYPKWQGDLSDIAFQFMLFRSTNKKHFTQVNDRPLIRLDGMANRFMDGSFEMGKRYYYKIVAVDAIGRISAAKMLEIRTEDQVPPEVPQHLKAEVRREKVFLSWNRVNDSDLKGYNIYRWIGDQKDSVQVNSIVLPVQSTEFIDSTMKYSVNYYYGVTAVDRSGNSSSHSNRASALVTDKTPPESASDLTASLVDNTVKLEWNPSPSADTKGYIVQRGYSKDNPYKLHEDIVLSTTFIDKESLKNKLIPGQKYYYSVVAVDTMTYESKPVGVWLTIPDNEPPESPGRIQANCINGNSVELKWNPSISLDTECYCICRIMKNDTIEVVKIMQQKNLFFVDEKLEKGSSVQYAITTIDTAGNESKPTFSEIIALRDFVKPAAPQFVSGKLTEDGILIIWEPVGDFDLAGYNIYRGKLRNAVGEKLNDAPVIELKWQEKLVKKNFYYWIKSVDTSGNESAKSMVIKI